MARHHEDLEKTFTDEQKEIFEKFHDCRDEYVSLAEAAIFEYAFCLGARLTMEMQSDINESQNRYLNNILYHFLIIFIIHS